MAMLRQSTTYTRTFLMVQSTDHVSGLTGATVTVKLSKAGGSGAAAGGTVSEVDSVNNPGLYKVALTTTDTNTLGDLAYHCTATGGDPTDFVDQVVSVQPLTTDVALNNFEFVMLQSGTNVPLTGATVTAQRSIDGGAFVACSNSPVEIANGFYKINLTAADMNGTVVALRFSATGGDDTDVTIVMGL
jgi:hypothetical protein